jgi:leucyl/phenylalanyl-tRNA--protein transferase
METARMSAKSRTSGDTIDVPVSVGPSRWEFPDPSLADEYGLVAIGADLEPSTLVCAYRRGLFPWPHGKPPHPWFSPDPRAIIPLDRVHVSRSLHRRLARSTWESTVDGAFDAVIAACADRHLDDDGGTWITADMAAAYSRLHRLGWAHSAEVWDGDRLVGGIYGVLVGAVFCGESMFHDATDASKAALVDLVARLREAGGAFLDVQMMTSHLASLGAIDVPRRDFLRDLARHRDREIELPTERRPVSRLASP